MCSIFSLIFFIEIRDIIVLSLIDQQMTSSGSKPIEIVKGRLYWLAADQPPKNIAKAFYFNIDNDLQYDSFNQDFGPLNLAKTWKYATELEKLMQHPNYQQNQIYHYTSNRYDKSANAAFLICAFQVIVLGYDSKKAFEPFKNINFTPFRDAGYTAECSYKCTILDCVRGIEYAIKIGWFNYKTFNLAEYEHYQRLENGDLNWVIPQKFVAFSSPYDKPTDKYGNRIFTPNDYVPVFKKMGVTTVVRLNNKTYESEDFKKKNIKHEELYFADGSVPSLDIVHKFIKLAEDEKGALAVHCKAGLGRTGTLIACYAMKHYGFPAADFIGWIRVVRPGSILGPQQNFLIEMQKIMRQQGAESPIWKKIRELVDEKELVSRMKNLGVGAMNEKEKQIMEKGDYGQGEGLVGAKQKNANKGVVNKDKNSPPNSPNSKK